MSTINEIFETASKKMSENLNITLHTSHELANIVAQVGAFKDRTNELNSEIVDEIVYDLFVALQLSVSGLYRHSFISSRCALELGVASLKFKDNNFSYLLRKKKGKDIVWSELSKDEFCVLSSNYLELFLPKGNFTKVIEMAKISYRECSEYVHGKYSYLTNINDLKFSYDLNLSHNSIESCLNVVKLLNILVYIRFGNKSDKHHELFEKLKKEFEV